MRLCVLCGNHPKGEPHDDHDEEYVCPKCFPIIKPLNDVRKEQLARLLRRRESATADNLKKGHW
jgi:hypothetical protein